MDQSNGFQPARGEQTDSVYELFILVVVASTMLMLATDYLPFVSGPTKTGPSMAQCLCGHWHPCWPTGRLLLKKPARSLTERSAALSSS